MILQNVKAPPSLRRNWTKLRKKPTVSYLVYKYIQLKNDCKLGGLYLKKRACIFDLFLLFARLLIFHSVAARILFHMDFRSPKFYLLENINSKHP